MTLGGVQAIHLVILGFEGIGKHITCFKSFLFIKP